MPPLENDREEDDTPTKTLPLNKSVLDIKEKKELNEIICPECKEMAIINFDEDKILINNCINKHNCINNSIKV